MLEVVGRKGISQNLEITRICELIGEIVHWN